MASVVKFNFIDSHGRKTSRSFAHTSDVLATVLADANTLAALWNPLTDLQMTGVVVTKKDATPSFAGVAGSNIDENVSVQILAADSFAYDVDLPDVPTAKLSGGTMVLTDADLVAFFAPFLAAGPWRVNLRNPTAFVSIVKAVLDK